MSNIKSIKKIISAIISLPVIIIILILMYLQPDFVIIGIDFITLTGAILIILFFIKLWKHEIKRLERLFEKIQVDLNLKDKMSDKEQEEFERYFVLKSTKQSIDTFQQNPNLLEGMTPNRIWHLRIQHLKNNFVILGHGIIWSLKLIIPFKFSDQPTLFDNIHTIFKKKEFLALRITLITWVTLFLIIFSLYLHTT